LAFKNLFENPLSPNILQAVSKTPRQTKSINQNSTKSAQTICCQNFTFSPKFHPPLALT